MAPAPPPAAQPRTEKPPPPAEPPAPAPLVDLPVPGHRPAVVSVPPGLDPEGAPRPLLVATHGARGTPEKLCALWREAVGELAFVLCPRGVTMDVYAPPESRGYFYPSHPALEREVRAALAALAERFPGRVDAARAVYAGFSQGAVMGALSFSARPAPFAGLVLIEGGDEEWSLHGARTFAAGGGQRVLFACGRARCAAAAKRSAGYLRRAGVEGRVVDASGAGHTYEGIVREGVLAAFPWLVGDDARWSAEPSTPSSSSPSRSRSPASTATR